MMVGFPGSGKSYFASYHASQSGYDVINRDTLGTWQKCSAEMQRSLDSGKSVLIDNTNPDKESRERFIVLALARKLPCRCFLMNTTATHALHNIKVTKTIENTLSTAQHMLCFWHENVDIRERMSTRLETDFMSGKFFSLFKPPTHNFIALQIFLLHFLKFFF